MFNIHLFLFEFGAIFAFLLIIFRERKNKNWLEVLLLAFLYGLTLETFDVHLSKSYSYSGDFFLQIYQIPIAIGMGWAIIYYICKKTAAGYNFKWHQEPFFMALVALSIDLAIDAVAIRLGFWSWRVSMNEEWFGVPYDNLFGWLVVIWTFSFLINLSAKDFLRKNIALFLKYFSWLISAILLSIQITIYVSLAAILSGKFTLSEVSNFYLRGDFSYAYYSEVQTHKAYIFFLVVFILVLYSLKLIYAGQKRFTRAREELNLFSPAIAISIHIFFFMR